MYVRAGAKKFKGLLVGLLIGLMILSGCATPTPAPAVPQEAVTSTPTAVPTAMTSPTAVPTETETTAPTSTATPVPTVVPTATPTTPVADLTCTLGPVAEMPDETELRDPGVYTVIGVANDDRLNVRTCPGAMHPIVHQLMPYSAGLQRAGQSREIEGQPWTPINYGGAAGWVNAGYLARQYGEADPEVAVRAGQIVRALREQDWDAVAAAVHPGVGARFSPYAFVRMGEGEDADRVFSAAELAGLAGDETIYHWGVFDGSGEPIEMSFIDYYARFIYDADFGWPYAVAYNEIVGSGNTINNLAEVYPQAEVVEYHLAGSDPRFGGMDWRSLRLALEKVGDTWYLVGLVHDEWTI